MSCQNLSKEIEEGNIEYKRYLINLDKDRLNQLVTQMNWRLNEGNNMAIYYLGVDDDGSPYNMTTMEQEESISNINKIVSMNSSNIIMMETIYTNSLKITIKRESQFSLKHREIRIILLGPTNSGKTTFLSNIILNRVDGNTEARMYMMNHKHELETRRTSSFNCHYIVHNNIKYTFIEAPGMTKYIRTKYRILLGTKPDIILLFPGNTFDEFICKQMKIPYLSVDPFDSNSIYYCKKLIDINKLLNNIRINAHNASAPILYSMTCTGTTCTKFNIMNVYPHNDMGLIVSGFLDSGNIKINQEILWKHPQSNNYVNCIVVSLHVNGEAYDNIDTPMILTICIKPKENIKKKWKYGQLVDRIESNRTVEKNYIMIKQTDNIHNMIGYYENQKDYIKNINTSEPIIIDNIGIIMNLH
jgi:GTPase